MPKVKKSATTNKIKTLQSMLDICEARYSFNKELYMTVTTTIEINDINFYKQFMQELGFNPEDFQKESSIINFVHDVQKCFISNLRNYETIRDRILDLLTNKGKENITNLLKLHQNILFYYTAEKMELKNFLILQHYINKQSNQNNHIYQGNILEYKFLLEILDKCTELCASEHEKLPEYLGKIVFVYNDLTTIKINNIRDMVGYHGLFPKDCRTMLKDINSKIENLLSTIEYKQDLQNIYYKLYKLRKEEYARLYQFYHKEIKNLEENKGKIRYQTEPGDKTGFSPGIVEVINRRIQLDKLLEKIDSYESQIKEILNLATNLTNSEEQSAAEIEIITVVDDKYAIDEDDQQVMKVELSEKDSQEQKIHLEESIQIKEVPHHEEGHQVDQNEGKPSTIENNKQNTSVVHAYKKTIKQQQGNNRKNKKQIQSESSSSVDSSVETHPMLSIDVIFKNRDELISIMDPRTKSVKFADAVRLVNRIGGKLESGSGSHHKMIFQKRLTGFMIDYTVGGIAKPHGKHDNELRSFNLQLFRNGIKKVLMPDWEKQLQLYQDNLVVNAPGYKSK